MRSAVILTLLPCPLFRSAPFSLNATVLVALSSPPLAFTGFIIHCASPGMSSHTIHRELAYTFSELPLMLPHIVCLKWCCASASYPLPLRAYLVYRLWVFSLVGAVSPPCSHCTHRATSLHEASSSMTFVAITTDCSVRVFEVHNNFHLGPRSHTMSFGSLAFLLPFVSRH